MQIGIPSSARARSDLAEWVAREERRNDTVSATACEALVSTLHNEANVFASESEAPLLSHWLHFWDVVPLAQTGRDGHPALGAFLPPVKLPRRMWAGSTLKFLRPLKIGRPIKRRSTIASIEEKLGRTGRLVFVGIDHIVSDAEGDILTDRHDIVYREEARLDSPIPPPVGAPELSQWVRRIQPDPVLLFRYSALTFNGHRIHYDRDYCNAREGYPGLVVHRPMIATYLLHELRRRHPSLRITDYRFRAIKPIFDTEMFEICGTLKAGEAELFARDLSGNLCMSAVAAFVER